jgi:hypothetical protein
MKREKALSHLKGLPKQGEQLGKLSPASLVLRLNGLKIHLVAKSIVGPVD